MSAPTRRSTAPRKRPDAPGAGVVVPVSREPDIDHAAAADAASASDPQQAAGELMRHVDDVLRGDASISQEERDAFRDQFAAALQDVVAFGNLTDVDVASTLQDSIADLKRQANDADSGDGSLSRKLDEALAPLERRETQTALEFGRRLEEEGQESALAWLRQQQKVEKQAADRDEGGPQDTIPLPASRSEVTRSRSRRLRGPPA